MPHRIIIQFPPDLSRDFYTQVFHFAESLYHPIVNAGLGKLDDIDQARETITIDLTANRHAAAVKAIIKKALQKHLLTFNATITTQ